MQLLHLMAELREAGYSEEMLVVEAVDHGRTYDQAVTFVLASRQSRVFSQAA